MFARMQRRIHDKDVPVDTGADSKEKVEVVTEERARELEALERNRQKVLEGTPVTVETFAIWKVKNLFVCFLFTILLLGFLFSCFIFFLW